MIIIFFLSWCFSRLNSVPLSLCLSLSAYRAGCWERILFSERKACFKCLLGWKRLHSLAVWCVLMPKHPASPCLSAVFHPLAADTLTHFSAVVLLSLCPRRVSPALSSFFFLFLVLFHPPCSRCLASCCTFALHYHFLSSVALMFPTRLQWCINSLFFFLFSFSPSNMS